MFFKDAEAFHLKRRSVLPEMSQRFSQYVPAKKYFAAADKKYAATDNSPKSYSFHRKMYGLTATR